MSSSRNTALMLLVIGGVFLLILAFWHTIDWLTYYELFGWRFSGLISVGLELLSSLLILLGFILFRGERSRLASQIGYATVQPTSPRAQSVPARFCPKCGKQIPEDAQFCPFCGWQPEGQKRK